MDNKKLYIWIVTGFVAAAVVIALAIKSDNAPVSVSQNQNRGAQVPPGVAVVNNRGQVIAPSGQVAENDAPAGAGDSPQESQPLTASEVPQDSVKIDVLDSSFSPSSFTVGAGKVVTLTFASKTTDKSRGTFVVFSDPSLSGIMVVLPPDTIKSISFNAPDNPGRYDFYKRGTDVKGTMVVK